MVRRRTNTGWCVPMLFVIDVKGANFCYGYTTWNVEVSFYKGLRFNYK